MLVNLVILALLAAPPAAPADTAGRAAGKQPVVVAPGPDAMALAARLATAPTPQEVENAEKNIANQLFSAWVVGMSQPCDRSDARCAAVSEQVAASNAGLALAAQRQAVQWARASILQQKMSPQEIAAANRYLTGAPGFASGLAALLDENSDPVMYYTAVMAGRDAAKQTWNLMSALKEFHDKTQGLPRTALPPAPAPPQPPRPKAN